MTTPDPLALAAMVAYCGWDPTVLVTDGVVNINGNGTPWAFLPSLNVTDVSAVTVTNGDGSTYTCTVGAGLGDVGWSEDGILTWQSTSNCGSWPLGQQSIAVTYSGGFNGPPPDLAAALASLGNRTAGALGFTSRKMGTASVGLTATAAEGGLLLVEQMVFDRYRLPRAK